MSVEIEVCERLADYHIEDGKRKSKYHAQIKDKPGFWAAGYSIDDAVGNLIRTHPEMFGVTVSWLGKQAR